MTYKLQRYIKTVPRDFGNEIAINKNATMQPRPFFSQDMPRVMNIIHSFVLFVWKIHYLKAENTASELSQIPPELNF